MYDVGCTMYDLKIPAPPARKLFIHYSPVFRLRKHTAASLLNPPDASKIPLRLRSASPAALAAKPDYRQSSIVNRKCIVWYACHVWGDMVGLGYAEEAREIDRF